jgi:hypothetical protein
LLSLLLSMAVLSSVSRCQDHLVNDRELKEKGVHGEHRHQRAPRRTDAAVGAVMAHDRAPPWPVSPAIPSECAVTPGERAPRGHSMAERRRGARPGPMGYPGAWRDAPAHRPSSNATSGVGVTSKQANAPGPGGHGRGRSRLGRKRPRGVPSRGRLSRVALARAFAGLRRYMGSEPPLGSTDAFMSGGGRQAPPPDPWPPSLATR